MVRIKTKPISGQDICTLLHFVSQINLSKLETVLELHNEESCILPLIMLIIFVLKMVSAFYDCCIYQMHFRLLLIMEVNTMDPDQTAAKVHFCQYENSFKGIVCLCLTTHRQLRSHGNWAMA